MAKGSGSGLRKPESSEQSCGIEPFGYAHELEFAFGREVGESRDAQPPGANAAERIDQAGEGLDAREAVDDAAVHDLLYAPRRLFDGPAETFGGHDRLDAAQLGAACRARVADRPRSMQEHGRPVESH